MADAKDMEKLSVNRRLALNVKVCFRTLEVANDRRRQVAALLARSFPAWGDPPSEVRNPFGLGDCCVIEQLLDRHICEYFSTSNVIRTIVNHLEVKLTYRAFRVMDAWRECLGLVHAARVRAFMEKMPAEADMVPLLARLTEVSYSVLELLDYIGAFIQSSALRTNGYKKVPPPPPPELREMKGRRFKSEPYF